MQNTNISSRGDHIIPEIHQCYKAEAWTGLVRFEVMTVIFKRRYPNVTTRGAELYVYIYMYTYSSFPVNDKDHVANLCFFYSISKPSRMHSHLPNLLEHFFGWCVCIAPGFSRKLYGVAPVLLHFVWVSPVVTWAMKQNLVDILGIVLHSFYEDYFINHFIYLPIKTTSIIDGEYPGPAVFF